MTIILIIPIVAFAAVVELARRLPLLTAFRRMAHATQVSARIWRYPAGLEERKERAVKAAARRLLIASSAALGVVLAVASPLVLVWLADTAFDLRILEALEDWRLRIVLLLTTVTYGIARTLLGRRLHQRR